MAYDDLRRKYQEITQAQELPEQPSEQDRAHLFTAGAAWLLPTAQALTTGVFFGALAWWAAWQFGKAPDPWRWGVGVFLAVQAIAWLAMLARWLDLTRPLERLTGLDLDRDGYIGDPPKTIRIELKHDSRRIQFIDLPYPDRLPDFCKAITNGAPLSESAWTGQNALFSKREFYTLRDELLKNKIIEWRNSAAPAQGLQVTSSGRAVIRYLANGYTSPTPDE